MASVYILFICGAMLAWLFLGVFLLESFIKKYDIGGYGRQHEKYIAVFGPFYALYRYAKVYYKIEVK